MCVCISQNRASYYNHSVTHIKEWPMMIDVRAAYHAPLVLKAIGTYLPYLGGSARLLLGLGLPERAMGWLPLH